MIIGHKKQRQFLKNSFELGRLSHAYLFFGPAHIGKKKIAIEFIKFLNCESKGKKPCNNCPSCLNIEKGIFPDFSLISTPTGAALASGIALTRRGRTVPVRIAPVDDKAVKNKSEEIKIDTIRNLEYYFNLSPSVSFIKSVVIDDAHLMTTEAQNCFLKTLEEPKGNALFILITDHPEAILPTILSRSQKIKFFLPKEKEIMNYLKKQNISDAKTKDIINLCSQKPGLAIDFLNDEKKLEYIKSKINEFDKIRVSDLSIKFEYAKQMSDYSNKKINEILDIWLSCTRKILLQENQSKRDEKRSRPFYSLEQLEKIIENIFNTRFLLRTTNINKKLAIENLMLFL